MADVKVVYDGGIEVETDPEEIVMQQVLKASQATFKEEQTTRDAAMARALATEEGPMSPTTTPKVVFDGSIEKDL